MKRTLTVLVVASIVGTACSGGLAEPPEPLDAASPVDAAPRGDGGFVDLTVDGGPREPDGASDATLADPAPPEDAATDAAATDAGAATDAAATDAGPRPCRPPSGNHDDILDTSCCTRATIPGCAGGERITVESTCVSRGNRPCGGKVSYHRAVLPDPTSMPQTTVLDRYPGRLTSGEALRLGYTCVSGWTQSTPIGRIAMVSGAGCGTANTEAICGFRSSNGVDSYTCGPQLGAGGVDRFAIVEYRAATGALEHGGSQTHHGNCPGGQYMGGSTSCLATLPPEP